MKRIQRKKQNKQQLFLYAEKCLLKTQDKLTKYCVTLSIEHNHHTECYLRNHTTNFSYV